MDTTTIILIVLATIVGAGLGGYIAVHQASQQVVKSIDVVRSDVQRFLSVADQKLAQFKIVVPPVEVPQPVIQTSLSPWSAFWLGLGFVGGMIAWRLLRPAWQKAESWAIKKGRTFYGYRKRKSKSRKQ